MNPGPLNREFQLRWGQGLLTYLEEFFRYSRKVSNDAPPGDGLLAYYESAPYPVVGWISLGFFVFGLLGLRRWRETRFPISRSVAFLFFTISALYFVIRQAVPVTKQWSAIIAFTLIGFSIDWANVLASKFSGWISQEHARTSIVTTIIVFALAVGQNAHHRFKRIPATSCGSKEQSIINEKLRALAASGEATPANVQVLVHDFMYSNFVYRLGWTPPYAYQWGDVRNDPKWVAGETRMLFSDHPRCEPYWRGDTFSIAKCAKQTRTIR